MQGKRYEGKDLMYLVVEPDDYSPDVNYPLVILLHGFGASMDDLAGLCPAIFRRGYLYACPNAPMPFAICPGMTGYGWTPRRGQGTPEDALSFYPADSSAQQPPAIAGIMATLSPSFKTVPVPSRKRISSSLT